MLSLLLVTALGQASGQDLSCRSSVREEQRMTRTQDGFTVTLRRSADPGPRATACSIEVHDPRGKVLFSREGYNTRVHRDSGRDVDNDGHPDLIIGHDASGGLCCWEYTILSLKPALHIAGTFSNPSLDVDVSRRTVVWNMVPFAELAPDMAQTPTIAVASQYRDGRFVDITAEYCPTILAGTARGVANLSDDLWRLEGTRLAASRAETGPPSFEVETTRVSATTVALQMMYCGRDADAGALVRRVWPDDEQAKVLESVGSAIANLRGR
jgi:hypothetical protein